MKVYLKYSFIFDPAGAWSTTYQFEDDLASYFRSMGYEAEVVKSSVDKSSIERIIYLDKLQPSFREAKPNPKALDTMRQHKTTPQEQKFKQGKFDPKKGYVKRGS